MGKKLQVNPRGPVEVVWNPPGGEDEVTMRFSPIGTLEAALAFEEHRQIGEPDKSKVRRGTVGVAALLAEHMVALEGAEVGGAPVLALDAIKPAGEPGVKLTQEIAGAFLSDHPGAYSAAVAAMFKRKDAARPNGSGGGSASASPIPESTAAKGTTTETGVPLATAAVGVGVAGG